MSTGSCMCGDVKYSFTGKPSDTVLCHCADCRKISGSTHSLNYLVGGDNFKVESGTPKTWAKTADSGQTITSYFCGNCGSTLWRESGTFPGAKIVKGGTTDGIHNDHTPGLELFSATRVSWQPAIPGATQNATMS